MTIAVHELAYTSDNEHPSWVAACTCGYTFTAETEQGALRSLQTHHLDANESEDTALLRRAYNVLSPLGRERNGEHMHVVRDIERLFTRRGLSLT